MQYFYLVVYTYDECTVPRKIFLQRVQAVRWGRREATKKLLETGDTNYKFKLYRQEITTSGELMWVKGQELNPYPHKELVDAGLVVPFLRQPDDDIFGADFGIDVKRL